MSEEGQPEKTAPKILFVVAGDTKTVFSGFASKDSHFSLRVEGKFGPKEIKNIIKLLETQLSLAEEEAYEA